MFDMIATHAFIGTKLLTENKYQESYLSKFSQISMNPLIKMKDKLKSLSIKGKMI